MAFERGSTQTAAGTIRIDSLDSFVDSLNKTFRNQMNIRNAEDEVNFNEQVLAGNMTLQNQLDYRKQQLKRTVDDPAERLRLRGEVSNLKDRMEQQAFTDAWAGKLGDFQGGAASIDSVIQFLEDSKAGTQDQNILNTINQKLADMQAQKFQLTQDLVKNSTEYAVNSKSVSVIEDQINKVKEYRNDAQLSGNKQLVSVYDLQIQTLGSAKNEAQIKNDILQLGAISTTGAYGAVSLLDEINRRINDASGEGAVSVGGTTYASTKDFWLNKRDSYLTDSGANGFFENLSSDIVKDLTKKESKNSLSVNDLQSVSQKFNQLMARSDLKNYVSQIDLYKQGVLQQGANKIITSIANEFDRTLDVNKAVSKLSSVKNLGVNVDDGYTKILQSNAANKSQQVQAILSRAAELIKANPNLTNAQAAEQAVKEGAGSLFSPNDFASKNAKDIAGGKATGKLDARTTLTGGVDVQSAGGLPRTGTQVIGTQYNGKTAPAGQVYIVKDGTVLLRPADNPTPELNNAPTSTPSSGGSSSGISVIGSTYNGKKAPEGQVYVNKEGTILLRPSTNPTPELNEAPAPKPSSSGGGGGSSSGGGGGGGGSSQPAPTANISVVGSTYNGQKAPAGQVYVNKEGTILLRPANNPTPEKKKK